MHKLHQFLFVSIIAISLSGSTALAWTQPTAQPPAGNVSTPINTSSVEQGKIGSLGIGGLIRGYFSALFTGTTSTNPVSGSCPSGYYWFDGNGNETIDNGECKVLSLFAGETGNVGIGTATPGEKLDVVGNINTTGGLYVSGTRKDTVWDANAPTANPAFTGTVSGITKAMVSLGSVDNTSDANKPVSTAQQTALNLKANLASPTFTGDVTMPGTGIWNSSGNVGIGTATPGVKLSVMDTISGVTTGLMVAPFYVPASSSYVCRYTGLSSDWCGGNRYNRSLLMNYPAYGGATLNASDQDGTARNLVLQTGTGNVGIGDGMKNPSSKLSIDGNIYSSGIITTAGTGSNFIGGSLTVNGATTITSSGSLTVNGATTLAGNLILSNGAGVAKVLTSDATGIGTWQSLSNRTIIRFAEPLPTCDINNQGELVWTNRKNQIGSALKFCGPSSSYYSRVWVSVVEL